MVLLTVREDARRPLNSRTHHPAFHLAPGSYCWSLNLAWPNKPIGMRAGELPDYATRVYHNVTVTSSLPLLALFSPTRDLYRAEPARKSDPSVDCRSLERKGGILRNVFHSVTKAVGYPIVSFVFGALSVAVCSVSVSVIAKMVTAKGEMPAIKDAMPKQGETPPPSRPPSPPPVSEPSGSESDSAWSIVIEELQDEPKPAVQQDRGRMSKRSRRSRSSSWSRSLMNSFRRKKTSRSEERHPAEPVEAEVHVKEQEVVAEQTAEPKKSASQVELSQVKPKPFRALSLGSFRRRKSDKQLMDNIESADQVESSVPAAAAAAVTVEASAEESPPVLTEEEATKIEAIDAKQRPSRLFGSFRRRKPSEPTDSAKPVEEIAQVADKDESAEVKTEPKSEVKAEAKPKSRMLSFGSFRRRKPDRSISLDQTINENSKDKIESKKDKLKKAEPKKEPTDEADSSKTKTKERPKAKPKEQTAKQSKNKANPEPEEVVETAEPPAAEAVAPKRKNNAFVSFFKREKKQLNASEVSHDPAVEAEPLKKSSKLRSSFGRRLKTKSVDVESSNTASTTKVSRSSSLLGSSFSLKRVFQPSDSEPQQPNKSPSGILTRRGGNSSGSRPKSVQLDDSPQFMEKEEGASKQTFGFSFKPKKPSRAKSLDESKPLEAVDMRSSSNVEAEASQGPPGEPTVDRNKEPVVTDAVPSDPVPEPSVEPAPAKPQTNARTTSSGSRARIDRDRAAIDQSIDEAFLQELMKSNPDAEKVSDVQLTSIKPAHDLPLKETVADVLTQLSSSPSIEGNQLKEILDNPLFQELIDTHDTVAAGFQERFSTDEPSSLDSSEPVEYPIEWDMPADMNAVRIVGLRRNPGEPLGLTVKTEDGQLVVARILGGGAVDRQGLLHVGDIIGEVNGVPVYTAEQLQVEIARSKEHVQLKILPNSQESIAHGAQVGIAPSTILAAETINSASACCVRAHFDYDPKEDKLLPCPEIGLAFKKGDILQVVNQSDPNWWQAKKVGWSGPAGLIPSQELEERRKAFVPPEADFVHKIGFCGARISKKKKKLMYQIKSSVELDKAELLLYEEVTRMPPFRRKTLVLVGSEGIGRRTLKNRLINSDPERFGTTLPHTSRPMRELEEDGMGYWFVSREELEHDIRDHQFLEYGEHNGHLYGTKLDSIRTVIRQGKMCVLDCSPNSLKILHNSPEFMPYVIFLAAPGMEQLKSLYEAASSRYSSRNLAGGTFERSSSIRFSSRRARTLESLVSLYEEEDFKNALEESARIQRTYEKYFDMVIVNEDPDHTFRKVIESLENLSNQHQWVPVSWVY